jgi:hypothetical protein
VTLVVVMIRVGVRRGGTSDFIRKQRRQLRFVRFHHSSNNYAHDKYDKCDYCFLHAFEISISCELYFESDTYEALSKL